MIIVKKYTSPETFFEAYARLGSNNMSVLLDCTGFVWQNTPTQMTKKTPSGLSMCLSSFSLASSKCSSLSLMKHVSLMTIMLKVSQLSTLFDVSGFSPS